MWPMVFAGWRAIEEVVAATARITLKLIAMKKNIPLLLPGGHGGAVVFSG
jgi:hypothetical protein